MQTEEVTEKTIGKIKQSEDKVNVYIVDHDVEYRTSLKDSLEKEFYETMNVKTFTTGEALIHEIKKAQKKPNVILLDYLGNRHLNLNSVKHIVDDISRISPGTGIIMLSHKEYEEQAMKALAYGAHDYVVKDKFTHEHVLNSVKKALNPPKS
jgi:DNA-binding NtrC family response regulator